MPAQEKRVHSRYVAPIFHSM